MVNFRSFFIPYFLQQNTGIEMLGGRTSAWLKNIFKSDRHPLCEVVMNVEFLTQFLPQWN